MVRHGDVWTADFHLDRPAPIWVFVRSSVTRDGELPWRTHDWVVETPGVRLERRGRYDVLVGENGAPVPAEVRLRFRPFAHDLLADSAPALAFSTGAIALFSRQFDLFALAGRRRRPRSCPPISAPPTIPYTRTRATFRDEAGPILYAGPAPAHGQPRRRGRHLCPVRAGRADVSAGHRDDHRSGACRPGLATR